MLRHELVDIGANGRFLGIHRGDAISESVYGPASRSHKIGDPAEKARSTVRWRIRDAIKKIAAAHPRLVQLLTNSIHTGVFCQYYLNAPSNGNCELTSKVGVE